jgi:hypothetical protein
MTQGRKRSVNNLVEHGVSSKMRSEYWLRYGECFRPIENDAETVERVVKAACSLHNYMLKLLNVLLKRRAVYTITR